MFRASCGLGGNHCRLRQVGWEQCGRGLTSRPKEKADPRALGPLLVLLGYPLCVDFDLLGTLKLRYCRIPFARKPPTWSILREGNVARLLTLDKMESCIDLHVAGGCVSGRAGGPLSAGGAGGLLERLDSGSAGGFLDRASAGKAGGF